MKKRVSKFIVSFAALVCLGVGFSVSAFADVVGGAGLLGSALGSLGVDLFGGAAGIGALAPWLSSDFSIIGALTGVADGYIKVNDDSVIIDGVEYQSIFLDPSMAAELHTQAFDFITQKAITSNTSGLLADGVGYCHGVPMYRDSQRNIQSAFYNLFTGGNQIGEYIINVTPAPTTLHPAEVQVQMTYPHSSLAVGDAPCQFYIEYSGSYRCRVKWPSGSSALAYTDFTSNPFTYTYSAGTIDATPLPVDYGFRALVPTQTLSQAGYVPGTYVIDGGTGTDEVRELIELLDQIYAQDQIKDGEFIEEIVPPVPPQPIDTPMGDLPYQDFLDTFGQSVYGKLDSISDGIDTVGQVIDGVGTDVIEAIDTAGQSVLDGLSDVEGAIDTAGQSVVDSVEESTGIIEEAIEAVEAKVDELADSIEEVIEEIMTHPLDLFSAWLDRLPEIPAIKDIFDGIKRHVGIWHYVVEWLGCIGTFLAFFIGLFGDVAYCMVVPIYACVAGAICLAFYKRFAR